MIKKMRNEEGQSMVEFALVLPILLVLVCGIIDFGWLFYNQLSLQDACREGARTACVNSTDVNINDTVKNKILENLPDGLKSTVTVTVTFSNAANKTNGDVTVKLNAKLKILTPVLGVFYTDQEKQLDDTVTMKVES